MVWGWWRGPREPPTTSVSCERRFICRVCWGCRPHQQRGNPALPFCRADLSSAAAAPQGGRSFWSMRGGAEDLPAGSSSLKWPRGEGEGNWTSSQLGFSLHIKESTSGQKDGKEGLPSCCLGVHAEAGEGQSQRRRHLSFLPPPSPEWVLRFSCRAVLTGSSSTPQPWG